MKIIEHGFYKQIITCGCGCKFKYDKEDIQSFDRVIFWGGGKSEKELYVLCPECQNKFYIPEKITSEL